MHPFIPCRSSWSGSLWQLALSRLIVGSGCAGFPLLVAIILTGAFPFVPSPGLACPFPVCKLNTPWTDRAPPPPLDIVPLSDFALWRSLIVCVQALGDVTGGPVGSAFADKLSWHA